MKLRQIVILVIIFFSIIVCGYYFMTYLAAQKKEPEKKEPKVQPITVRVSSLKIESINAQIRGYGKVQSSHPIVLTPEVSGKMEAGDVQFKTAVKFSKGTLLYKIDDREAVYNLKAQKSEYLNNLANSLPDIQVDFKDEYNKWKNYFDQINIEKPIPNIPDFNSTKEKTFFSTKNIINKYYTIKSQEERISKYKYYAPFQGSFASVDVEVGSIIGPGTRLAKIIRTDQSEAVIPIPVQDIKWIPLNSVVNLFTEDNKSKWTGYVSRISDIVDERTQSVNVFVSLYPTYTNSLFDGQFLFGEFSGKSIHQVMKVNRSALFRTNHIYIVEDGLLIDRIVNVVKFEGMFAYITGLSENTKVVNEPLTNVKDGLHVNVIES